MVRDADLQGLIDRLADSLRAGDTAAARPLADRLAEAAPDDAEGLHLRGLLALAEDDPAAAEPLLAAAAAGDPTAARFLGNLAIARRRLGDLAGAEAAYVAALALEPERPEFHANLANLLKEAGRLDAAEAAYRRAVALAPGYAKVHFNLGGLYRDAFRFPEAEAAFRAALEASGGALVEARVNLAQVLELQDRLDDALACLDEAIRQRPDHVNARWNRSLLLLKAGDLAAGLPDYEWRWRLPEHQPRALGRPGWAGDPQPGATVLVHAEQGLGDTLMYCRWLPQVAARAGHVVFECQPSLVRLMAASFPGVTVVAAGEALPPFDCHVPLMSLPLILGVTAPGPATAGDGRYLTPPAGPHAVAAGEGLKVGLVWSGGPGHKPTSRLRSLPFADLAPLWAVPGVRFFSLQVGEPVADLAAAPVPVVDLGSGLKDFADTAAAIAAMDVVITVDTSVAHLAGGLGVPTWILLFQWADWRWFLDRADSPWYPTATLFRQHTVRQWGPVVEQVAARLERCAREGARGLLGP